VDDEAGHGGGSGSKLGDFIQPHRMITHVVVVLRMSMPRPRTIELCNHALEGVRVIIPSELHTSVSDYINCHNEWGVGMELLVDQLNEGGIWITLAQFTLIETAMASMGLADDPSVTYLREHYVNT